MTKVSYHRDFESSNIGAIGYEDGKIFVEFLNLKRFAYTAPKALFQQLLDAKKKSVGRFFAANIKGKFAVAWAGWRCNLSPCQNDATLEGSAVAGGEKFRVCEGCAKTGPYANVALTPIAEQKHEG